MNECQDKLTCCKEWKAIIESNECSFCNESVVVISINQLITQKEDIHAFFLKNKCEVLRKLVMQEVMINPDIMPEFFEMSTNDIN